MVLAELRVSVIMPVRNEEDHLARSLESILANDYPRERLEVIVIDGRSSDRSTDIVRQYALNHPGVRLLDNPRRIVPAGLNIGIRESRGEIIVRTDAHTVYAPDYVRACAELLETTGAASVGGIQRAVGSDYVSRTIAIAMTTPFGVGNAPYRYVDHETWVDTVYLGAWRRETLERLGGFDEAWVVNQDYELNVRLRQAGGRILLSPRIRCWYAVRPTLRALARQWLRYGFWRVKTLATYPTSLQPRQLAPPGVTLGLLLSLLVLPFSRTLACVVPAAYAVASLIAAVAAGSRRGWRYLPLLPLAFATIHLSWGVGFLAGLFRWGLPGLAPPSRADAPSAGPPDVGDTEGGVT
jgi:GT2 family glycosyltransferase